ncbi:hypothetical protein [Streptomyces sp. JW3]|uniref:hypothetical protein n=1 Tax=Streptomyces sp. JW3 TaxID=3456955 RepID=UPI003FA48C3B
MTTQPPPPPGFQQQPGFPQQPGQPQQAGFPPQQLGYPQPPVPLKKRSVAKLGCLGVLAVMVIGGIASVAGSGSDDSAAGSGTGAASASSGTESSTSSPSAAAAAPRQSTVDAFKAYVKKHETAATQEAATHVTKVQGADENNDILDTAEIHTDYTGDLISADAGKAKLLASAFADFQADRGNDSENGLVTVYNAAGDILSNGNY